MADNGSEEQPDKSALARTGDKGDSSLTITAKKTEPPAVPPKRFSYEKYDIPVEQGGYLRADGTTDFEAADADQTADKTAASAPPLTPSRAEQPQETSSTEIFGRQGIFHYNYDGSRDKEAQGSQGFFGANLDDPNLVGAALPLPLLEAQFGTFTQKLPDGTSAPLNTPEAHDIIQRIKAAHIDVMALDGQKLEVPIVNITSPSKTGLGLTLGAAQKLGIKDDTYLGYSIVAADGTVLNADKSWSDQSPLAKLYREHGKEFSQVSPQAVLAAAKESIAPDMPQEDYERAMRAEDGRAQLAKYKAKPKDPGERLAAIQGTAYYGLGKDELTKKVYSDLVRMGKIDPAKTDLAEIGDKLFPHPGFLQSLSEVFNWNSSFWKAARAGASEMTHEMSGQLYDFPTNLEQWDQQVYGAIPGANQLRGALDKWLETNLGLPNYFKNFVGYLHGQAQAQGQSAQADAQRRALSSGTVPGQVGGILGGVGAGTLLSVPTLLPGASVKTAVTLAGVYEGISRYGEAAQKGQSDALIQGIEGLGMGALQRYLMDAPNGRAMSGFLTWLTGAGEDTLSRMLKGEQIDLTEVMTHSGVDLASGWLMGKAREKPRTGLADELVRAPEERARLREMVLGPEEGGTVPEQEPGYAPGPIVTRIPERETFTPSELSLAAGELPSGASPSELARRAGLLRPPPSPRGLREVHLGGTIPERSKILQAQAQAMQQALEDGDSPRALEHGNRALATLNGQEQKGLAQDVISLSEKWADNTATPGTEPTIKLSDTEKGLISHFAGLGSVEILEDRSLPPAETIHTHLDVEGIEKNGDRAPVSAPAAALEGAVAEPTAVAPAPPRPEEVSQRAPVAAVPKPEAQAVSDELETIAPPEVPRGGPEVAPTTESVPPSALADWRAQYLAGLHPEARARFERMAPEDQERYLRHAQSVSRSYEATRAPGEVPAPAEGTEFHAGLPVAPAARALRRGVHVMGQADPIMAIRERMGGVSPTMTGLIRARRSEAEAGIAQLPSQTAHDMRVDKVLRGGEKTAVRRDFFARFAQPVQLAMMIAHEKGQPVGHAVAQELFKLHDAIYKAIERLEKKAGFTYKARETYIYHLIKGGKAERARYEAYYNALVAANPRFTHSRHFGTLEALHKAGFKLETYNPEELMQRRLFQSQMAITKVMQLRDAERAGLAYRTDHPGLGAGIKAWGEPVRAPNGERYYVRPDAQVPLHNAWDLTSLYSDRVWGKPLKALAMLKGAAIPLKLGYSFVHGKHIGLKMNLASFASTMSRAALHGNARGQVWARELERLLKFGYAHSAEVKTLQGRRPGKGLSLEQKTNIKHFEWAGLSARISDETRLSFDAWGRQLLSNQFDRLGVPRGTRAKVHGAATLLQAGYDIVSSKAMQHWMFNTLIPQIKFSQFLGMRDNLIRERPELLEDRNEFKLKRELTKIGESVEARFGEMFYDNLLWKKTWKDVGTATLLSFGWNLGAIRIYAGAIRDTAALGTKILEDGHISRNDLTDRMLFAGWYTGLNMLEAGLITYTSVSLWNATHPDQRQNPVPEGMDWVFPRVGYDSGGRAKRVSPVEYSREFSTWWQHTQDQGLIPGTAQMIRNKLSPTLSTLIEDFQNRNFFGQEIYDPNDPWLKQVQDVVGYTIGNTFGPISLSATPVIGQKSGRELSWGDTAWAAIGFPPAAAWTGRNAIENRIVDTYHQTHPATPRSEQNTQRAHQYEALRRAVVDRNPAAGRAAEKALADFGVPKSSISYIRNHPHETYEQHLFKGLSASDQLKLLKLMKPDELHQYWPLAHKDLHKKFLTETSVKTAP